MTTHAISHDRFNWARAAGIAYLGVAFLAGFAEFSVRTGMVVPGDAAATVAAIAANQTLYSLAGIADLFVLLLDAFLGLALWVLLRPVDKNLALLALFLNLLRLPWMGANAIFHFGVLLLVNGALPSFSTEQIQELSQLFLNLHAYGYTANGVLFGSWCFVVGLLFYRSGFIPRLLGAAMMLALVGYWTDLIVVFLMPELEPIVSPIAVMPAALAEIATALWLTIMGGRVYRGYRARISGVPATEAI